MAIEGSGYIEQASALLEPATEFLRADPVFSAAMVAIVVLAVLLVFRRRTVSKQAPIAAPAITAAPTRRPRRQTHKPIDERFDALRLQTEELDALAPPPRHFKTEGKSTASYQLRRR